MRRTPTQRAVAAVLVAGATGAGVASPMGDMRDRVASLSGGGYSRTRNVVRMSKYMGTTGTAHARCTSRICRVRIQGFIQLSSVTPLTAARVPPVSGTIGTTESPGRC
ncbi:MAG: hypothetical protein J07HQW1_01335 [Haloquadratum walsbyi J07HQW1]|uniref:Uncharacterized protein n=1 Tax=Haloquadratum walsbyi J07HQW1 TaxID=1238424 RepID=U1PGP5_9EURY|nr:MAG: hypothetical protein J07HQW1_01335 [Haloquadratum walsbyi J07HQW1]